MSSTETRDIPGIYNYCDRWCERCAFTAQCRVYKDVDERGGHDPDMSMESTIDFVTAAFEETCRTLEAETAARGIPLPTETELAAIDREAHARRDALGRHPLVQLADRYTALAREWWPTERELLRAKADGLVARCGAPDDPERLEAEARGVLDATQAIQWHLHQIAIKLRRALTNRNEGRWGRKDANGSAKVALIGIDRSLAAWHVLQQWCPETTTHQLVVDTLTELRIAAEREFPKARAFKRPGFDGGKRWH
jgi:hypothetical protein